MKNRVAIYCRLSEEDRNKQNASDDSKSIKNQKAMLCDHAMRMGWEIYGIYSDDDYTGADRERPAFKRLINDASEKRFDIVLCKTQSRFTRELELVEHYIHGLFPLWGIRFVSIVDNADTENKGNKKSRQINGLVNEWYLEDMSESIKSALDIRRRNGYHIGSFALYGYKKDPDVKGHLIIDEEAAAVVREVFTLFSQGYGKSAIARMLNDKGVPNPTEYKRINGLRYKIPQKKTSGLWKYSSVSDMLKNEMYIGNMVQGRYGSVSYKTSKNQARPQEQWYVVENTHEPIIERDLWDRVQKLLSERTRPYRSGEVGLFSGRVRCASCGSLLRSSISGGRRFLQCPSRYASKDSCEGAFISVERLERIVLLELKRISEKYLDVDRLMESIDIADDIRKKAESIKNEISFCEGKINELRSAIRELYFDKSRGILSQRDFDDLLGDFTVRRERLEMLLCECQRRLENILDESRSKDKRSIVEKYINSEHLSRDILGRLVEKITVGKRIGGTRNVPIEIYWSF